MSQFRIRTVKPVFHLVLGRPTASRTETATADYYTDKEPDARWLFAHFFHVCTGMSEVILYGPNGVELSRESRPLDEVERTFPL